MNKYLIDTHVLLWMTHQSINIPALSKDILVSENKILLSYVSVWEIAVKLKTQKLNLENELPDYISESIEKYNLELLPISLKHIYYTQELTLHHRDPFDRLLIARSISEDISIISSDEAFDAYEVKRIWR